MLQPAPLKSDQKLLWSAGRGTEVWALFQACAAGDPPVERSSDAAWRNCCFPSVPRRRKITPAQSPPLAWAAKFNQLEMVKFLLARGVPTSLPDDPAWATPLAWAARRGNEAVVRLLR